MDATTETSRFDQERSGRTTSGRRRAAAATAGLALILGLTLTPTSSSADTTPPTCAPKAAGQPMWITADCVDPTYGKPVVDSEKDVAGSTPYHQVSGHFEGTTSRFNFYFPPKSEWEGRFYQIVYPLQTEDATSADIALAFDSGAYRVQTNGKTGYRVDAAAAKFSRTVAADYYRTRRQVRGYIYGGSGGSYQTIGAIENTKDVWDGAVPWIPATPTSLPNNFFARAFARVVLEDKAADIGDAVQAGGSGDPYAGLTSVQRAVLQEVTKMGVPLRAWKNYRYLLGLDDAQGLLSAGSIVRALDPTYAEDFWSKPGYLGSEQSTLGGIFRAARIDRFATVTEVKRDAEGKPTSLVLDDVPPNPRNTPLDLTAYDSDGTAKVGSITGTVDQKTNTVAIGSATSAAVLSALDAGSKLRIDNGWSLSLTAYHRYQVPKRAGFYAWDQFRDGAGQPIYPQRGIEVGPTISNSVAGGGSFSGQITAKVIAVSNLLDVDAYPWDADWYATQVKRALGSAYGDNFRVWYNDNADHIGAHAPGLVDYLGMVEQALRDVSAWVEEGVAPPLSTRYKVVDSQIEVSDSATERRGIQPTVNLTASGRRSVTISAGQRVTLDAKIQVPPGAGKVVSTGWDPTGSTKFSTSAFGAPRPYVELKRTFVYDKPGVYMATLRITANRPGDPDAAFGNVQNLGTVRVVVR